jgi:hypothetical protein
MVSIVLLVDYKQETSLMHLRPSLSNETPYDDTDEKDDGKQKTPDSSVVTVTSGIKVRTDHRTFSNLKLTTMMILRL